MTQGRSVRVWVVVLGLVAAGLCWLGGVMMGAALTLPVYPPPLVWERVVEVPAPVVPGEERAVSNLPNNDYLAASGLAPEACPGPFLLNGAAVARATRARDAGEEMVFLLQASSEEAYAGGDNLVGLQSGMTLIVNPGSHAVSLSPSGQEGYLATADGVTFVRETAADPLVGWHAATGRRVRGLVTFALSAVSGPITALQLRLPREASIGHAPTLTFAVTVLAGTLASYPPEVGGDASLWVLSEEASIWDDSEDPPAPNVPPTADGTATELGRQLTIHDTSSDTDGTIASVTVDWDEGNGPQAMTVGGSATHTYPDATADYTVTLTATDDDGDSDTWTYDFAVTASVGEPGGGDWSYLLYPVARRITTDARGVTAPSGQTVTGYSWDFGDNTSASAGVMQVHHYAASGIYTVALTVSYSDGGVSTTMKEVQMGAIIEVSPVRAARGEEITITGSGFGATQGTVTVTAGGKALTNITWATDSITGQLATDCPLGAIDVVVTPANGTAITKQGAVYCYDVTNQNDSSQVHFGAVKRIFWDGLHLGFTSQGVELPIRKATKKYVPDDREIAVTGRSRISEASVGFTLDQFDPVHVAALLGGTYDETSKVLTITGGAEHRMASFGVEEEDGRFWFLPRVMVEGDITITMNKEFSGLPVTAGVYSLDDPAEGLMRVDWGSVE